jgi:hypothetical protein
MVGQAQVGKRSSIPKIVNIKADDNTKLIFKNVGNNHAYPMIWADKITMSGTEVVLASGVKFHGYDLASYGSITATPSSAVSTPYYITRDTVNNVVKIESTGSVNSDFDVQIILGDNAPARFIEKYVH